MTAERGFRWRCAECGWSYGVAEVRYTCPACGDSGLLDGEPDYEAARRGARAGIEAGAGTGARARARTGARAGTGARGGTGARAGTGAGTGAGAGTGTGAGAGARAGIEAGRPGLWRYSPLLPARQPDGGGLVAGGTPLTE